jgi:hypothetical protein
LIEGYSDSDRVLLAEIGLYGRYVEIPEYLFIHREHGNRSVRQFKSRQTRNEFIDPSTKGKPVYPYTRELFAFLSAVRRAPLSLSQKRACYAHMFGWAARHAGDLAEDYSYALRLLLRPAKRKLFPSKRGGQGGLVA